jgi:hypothetical protein
MSDEQGKRLRTLFRVGGDFALGLMQASAASFRAFAEAQRHERGKPLAVRASESAEVFFKEGTAVAHEAAEDLRDHLTRGETKTRRR